jgi:hypothetical protein
MADEQDRLRTALHGAADPIDLPVIDWTARVAASRARRRRARRGAMAGVLAMSALVVGVAVARSSGGGQTVRSGTPGSDVAEPPAVVPTPGLNETTTTMASGTAPAVDLVWKELAPPPIPIRSGIVTAWTGSEYLAIGLGSDSPQSAAYDPATDRWRTIATSPLAPRTDAVTAWTGSKLIVWGGVGIDDGAAPLDDGALYDPVADEWYPMASLAGGGRQASGTAAVWAGRELLIWGGGVGPNDGAAYDPTADSWRPLPVAPIEWRDSPAGVWTGSELIAWGGSRTVDGVVGNVADGAAYSPTSDEWRTLPPAPMQAAVVDAAWTGARAVFTPGYSGDPAGVPFAHATGGVYDPATDSWTPANWIGQHPGTELLAVKGQLLATAKGHSVLLDPTTGGATDVLGDEVSTGADAVTAAWTGSQVLALRTDGGLIGATIGSAPARETCTVPAEGPPATDVGWSIAVLPLAPRTGAATAWTGTEYIAWGGTDGTTVFADGVVVDPATGDIRTMSTAPIDARTGALAVWTGREVIIAGGASGLGLSEPLTSQPAAAYDPAADQWRLIPRSNVQLDLLGGPPAPITVWTGTELYALLDNVGGVFDPASGLWLALPRVPGESLLAAVWDERELLVVTSTSSAAIAVYAYEPVDARPANDDMMESAGGAWQEVSISPAAISGSVAAWADGRLLIAGGGDPGGTTWGSASFDPTTGEWRRLDATPYHPGADLVWTGTEALFVIKGGFTVIDPVTGQITEKSSPMWLHPGTAHGTGDGAVFLGEVNTDDCRRVLAVGRYRP